MRYHVLASDYDETLATHGQLPDSTRKALERLRRSGRQAVLVTGRRVDDLLPSCPDLSPFEVVVAENGAVLYRPATKERRVLTEPPPAAFVERLRALGVNDLAVGQVVVATWQPHESAVLTAIRELGLELQVIFNKGAVMVLPSGVNKATGLAAALSALGYSPHEAVAVGDAENDHALLAFCECGVAVQNALPTLKERADLVTRAERSAGVEELIGRLLENDLADLSPALARHDIPIGTARSGAVETLPAYGSTTLLAGTSGAGKSTLVTAFAEQLGERGYQFCILDPEGDYSGVPGAAVVGDRQSAPTVAEVLKLLELATAHLVVNLVAIGIENRPAFFEELLPQLQGFRARRGRPHFIILDETHHLAGNDARSSAARSGDWSNVLLVTVHPKHVSDALLAHVDTLLVLGAAPAETFSEFAASVGEQPPALGVGSLDVGELLLWRRGEREARPLRTIEPATERKRHARKYAAGDLEDCSFYFRGPKNELNLRAQNLQVFLQMADGVDDATWRHHLERGDYVRWMRECIKDEGLADEVAGLVREGGQLSPRETRAAVRGAIERRYTAPA